MELCAEMINQQRPPRTSKWSRIYSHMLGSYCCWFTGTNKIRNQKAKHKQIEHENILKIVKRPKQKCKPPEMSLTFLIFNAKLRHFDVVTLCLIIFYIYFNACICILTSFLCFSIVGKLLSFLLSLLSTMTFGENRDFLLVKFLCAIKNKLWKYDFFLNLKNPGSFELL